MHLARSLGAAGAILVAASLVPLATAHAEDPPAPVLVLEPSTGNTPSEDGSVPGTPAVWRSDTPCPESHAAGVTWYFSGPQGSWSLDLALGPDRVPDIRTEVPDGFAFFDFGPFYPADGSVWKLSVSCKDTNGALVENGTVNIKVTGHTWAAQTAPPVEYHPVIGGTPTLVAGRAQALSVQGFKAGEEVVLSARPEADASAVPQTLAAWTANASGNVDGGAVTVPAAWTSGKYRFFATGSTTHAVAEAAGTVRAANLGVTAAPAAGKAGDSIAVAVTGFQGGEQVDLAIGPVDGAKTALGSVTADAQGAASKAVTLPAGLPVGPQNRVTAQGRTSGVDALVAFTVTPPTTAPPTSPPPTTEEPTEEPTTPDPDPTTTAPSGTSGGTANNTGGGALAHTGALWDPRVFGSFGALLMASSAALYYRHRRRSPMLEGVLPDAD